MFKLNVNINPIFKRKKRPKKTLIIVKLKRVIK